ncbi:MAG TPA: sigma-70 family RNA polymerase sigma factor [Bryobacteraceae bacterium]|nr:sigma-70 family RNA polymerase sigma factor [Bryobacteraceae bacterium]
MASDPVTQLLLQASGGNRAAVDALTPLVYQELKRIAGGQLRNERPGHTLQATALVHEAYLKLVDQREVAWQNRAHFFGIASQIMRRIVLDYAKQRLRDKRGGRMHKTTLDEALVVSEDRASSLVMIDEALTRLEQLDARQARIVEMRFFAGLSVEETAEAMGISAPTVKREWAMARAWLHRELAAR